MNYERLDIQQFGQHLLETNDLDPVYVALVAQSWSGETLRRWLIAYWCFYHCGVASWLAEHESMSFWAGMIEAARNVNCPVGERWPRGRERRHFRGAQAIMAIEELCLAYPNQPERMVDWIAMAAPSYIEVAERVRTHRGFGPWISFKIADMIERVLGIHINFETAHVFMFKDPQKAALMLWSQHHGGARPKDPQLAVRQVVDHLLKVFNAYKAPPRGDRAIGLQEVETILCCWKSHMNGHYPLYNDQVEINTGLIPWLGYSKLAGDFHRAMPKRSE